MGPTIIIGIIVVVIGLIIAASGIFTVQQQTRVIIERFGRFERVAPPGLNFKIPIVDRNAGTVTHRVRELEISVESKTKDDVFVDLLIAVQFFVKENENRCARPSTS
jgi:regulator of protease activity HflC (stomatin/prohibitin superfamily)